MFFGPVREGMLPFRNASSPSFRAVGALPASRSDALPVMRSVTLPSREAATSRRFSAYCILHSDLLSHNAAFSILHSAFTKQPAGDFIDILKGLKFVFC